jgi:hypothetical protein
MGFKYVFPEKIIWGIKSRNLGGCKLLIWRTENKSCSKVAVLNLVGRT